MIKVKSVFERLLSRLFPVRPVTVQPRMPEVSSPGLISIIRRTANVNEEN